MLGRIKTIATLIMFFIIGINISAAQKHELLDSLSSRTYIDSLLIDHNPANYSFRIFSNLKSQSFLFSNGTDFAHFSPNNRAGIGVGFASKKILVDIAFNIKLKEKHPTKRFDVRASFKHKKHYFDYFFQHYKGFNIESSWQNTSAFRTDVSSFANGLNYLYLFNDKNYQVGTLRSLISEKNKTSFSMGLGGFALALYQKGDYPLVQAQFYNQNLSHGINTISGIGGGALAGLGGFFSMGNNWYSSLNITGGLGLMYKEMLDHQSFSSHPIIYQANTTATIGYVHHKYYLNLSLDMGYYSTEIVQNINEHFIVSQAKLAFGYKFFKKQ